MVNIITSNKLFFSRLKLNEMVPARELKREIGTGCARL